VRLQVAFRALRRFRGYQQRQQGQLISKSRGKRLCGRTRRRMQSERSS
jgi:hypothetical protein